MNLYPGASSPDEWVRQQAIKLEEIRRRGGEKIYWQCVAKLCQQSEWFIIRYILDWGWIDEDLIGSDLLGFYHRNDNADTAVFIPRGFCKTLTESARLVRRFINKPHGAWLYASATEDLANDVGKMVGDILLNNRKLHKAFPDILPESPSDVKRWGKDGYELPGRNPRIDPTLACISIGSNRTGYHPDEAFVDDLIVLQNNNPTGWKKAEEFLNNVKMLLPAHGVIHLTGTRWGDGDPYGKIIRGVIEGKRGPFKVLIRSCWEDDNPAKRVLYPEKVRWNMSTPTGYTHERLVALRRPKEDGGLGVFFDAQMRNDPRPEDRQDVKIAYINRYDKKDTPKRLSHIRSFGVEITGGGRPILNLLIEKLDKLKLSMPLQEMASPRTQGETKADKIRAILEPIVNSGHLYAQEWMVSEPQAPGNLAYELGRLGAASNDDIADALHCVPLHLSGSTRPHENEPLHLYCSCDLAYTEKKQSDWTVIMAVAVDSKDNYWVLDYDRFQLNSPTGICDRLIEFYRKWSPEDDATAQRRYRNNFAMSYK